MSDIRGAGEERIKIVPFIEILILNIRIVDKDNGDYLDFRLRITDRFTKYARYVITK